MSNAGKGPSLKQNKPFVEDEEAAERVTSTEGIEDSPDGFLQNLFTFGSQNQPFQATDYSDSYAKKGYLIYFTHLPSGRTLSFKGFITQFSDNFNSNWTPTSVYGRMDDIQTFQATKRQINVGFVIPAFDADEARCNLAKVTSLMRKLYPHYSGEGADNVSTLSRAPLMRIRFTNLIRNGAPGGGGLLGKVNGFTFTPNLEHGFFDYTNTLYPKTIDIGFTFDVQHEHILGWTDTEDEEGNPNGVIWADGEAPGFSYITPKINEKQDVLASEAVDEDEEATANSILFS